MSNAVELNNIFRNAGFTLRKDAMAFIADGLQSGGLDVQEVLKKLEGRIRKSNYYLNTLSYCYVLPLEINLSY